MQSLSGAEKMLPGASHMYPNPCQVCTPEGKLSVPSCTSPPRHQPAGQLRAGIPHEEVHLDTARSHSP